MYVHGRRHSVMCTHMVLECVDSYMHWVATKQPVYRVSTTTLQTLHARVVWGWSNTYKNLSPNTGGTKKEIA